MKVDINETKKRKVINRENSMKQKIISLKRLIKLMKKTDKEKENKLLILGTKLGHYYRSCR